MTTVAHRISDKNRTNDVLISENISFDGLLLSDKVLNGLKNAGFIKPSPIQLKAIPLGRCGLGILSNTQFFVKGLGIMPGNALALDQENL